MQNVNLIIKPTTACNAKCIYCSAWKEGANSSWMTDETLKTLMERLEESVVSAGMPKKINFTWHGGEPLLVGNEFYFKVMDLQEKLLKSRGVEVENSIQTNLLALDEEKAKMLTKLLMKADGTMSGVGTSFDPIPEVRMMKSGEYESLWFRALELLEKHSIPYGVICVVHKMSLGKEEFIFNYLAEKCPGKGTRYNPIYEEGRATEEESYHITSMEWGEFMVNLYRLWEAGGKKEKMEPLMEWENYHYRGVHELCCEAESRCAINHLGIDTDGTVYSCGRGIDRGTRPYGNLMEEPLSRILDSTHRRQIENRRVFLQDTDCAGCDWWTYCHGGCYIDSEISYDNIFHKTRWCAGRRHFFETIFGEPRKDNATEAIVKGVSSYATFD